MNFKLVIAEKPSAAKSYADALGAKTKKDGYYKGNGYIVSWCIGHLLGLASPQTYNDKYASWRKEDLPISPDVWKYEATPSTKKQLKVLVALMKRQDVELVINGADAGREGELIFRLVYEYAKCIKPTKRLWVSSMEETALKEGFNNLKNGSDYDRLAEAAKCRSQADWLVGMNYTRLFSIVHNASLRVGRVQTPTLAMVVARYHKINNFTKEPFYVVELTLDGFKLERERVLDKLLAEKIANNCNAQTATIRNIEKNDKSIAPPKLYDLTTLQREANKLFGLTASKTLEVVQSLYEKKILTYPRTDSKYITADMVGGISNLASQCKKMLQHSTNFATSNVDLIVDNSKVTDHHAILPTPQIANLNISSLETNERNILKMVATRLLCAISDRHTYAETIVTAECSGEIFSIKGKAVKNNGWKQIEAEFLNTIKGNKEPKEDTQALPSNLFMGQKQVASASIREGATSPPKHYTEDTLLSAMESAGAEGVTEDVERKGLGTPATRAGIIENLVKNEFLVRDKKNLLPTEKGINLIKILPDKVKSPLLTAEWENNLKRMERGEVSPKAFMLEIISFISEVVTNYGGIENTEPTIFSNAEPIGKCPRCGANVIETSKAFSCENVRNKSCSFALWKENKFFTSQGKKITKGVATQLLNNGQIFIPDLKSQKTGKKYGATILLDDNKEGFASFKLEFSKNK